MLKNATNFTTPKIKTVPKLEKDHFKRNLLLITSLWSAAICLIGYAITVVIF